MKPIIRTGSEREKTTAGVSDTLRKSSSEVPHLDDNVDDVVGVSESSVDSISSSQMHRHYWQIFFIPQGDIYQPSSFFAFCPFTLISAEGPTIEEACRKWSSTAKKTLGRKLFIPKYSLSSRKVWYGSKEKPSNPNNPNQNDENNVFVIDLNVSNQGHLQNDSKGSVAFCPQTQQILTGNISDWRDNPSDATKWLPSMWFDWRIRCTSIQFWDEGDSQQQIQTSLTPHCIN